jgi:6-phosphogluconolactonase|tara:strand:+ start:11798 stop:12442 length:645 start_codon:yes stop_codon:yes gene_type:complete
VNLDNKNIYKFNSNEELNSTLLKLFKGTKNNRVSNIIFSGGSTPTDFYKLLSIEPINWPDYQIVLSDERNVKLSNPMSTEGAIKSIINNQSFNNSFISLLDEDVETKLSLIDAYDLSILGVGEDGHFASIFPNMSNLSSALNDNSALININDGFPDVPRVTLSLNEINKSQQIILLIKGENKFNLLTKNRSEKDLLPIDYLFLKMSEKIKVFYL